MRKYPKYKASGVDWLGEIPSDWSITRIKRLAKKGRKTFIDGDWIESEFISSEGIRLIQTGEVKVGYYKDQGFRYITEKTFFKLNCTEIFPDEILICRLASPVGRACLVPDNGERIITVVDNCILKSSNSNSSKFIVYLFSSSYYLEYLDLSLIHISEPTRPY